VADQAQPGTTINDKEADTRHRAQKIWESEGRPEGEHERHWLQAEEELTTKSRRIPVKKKDTGSVALTSSLRQGGAKPGGGPAGTGAHSITNTKKR